MRKKVLWNPSDPPPSPFVIFFSLTKFRFFKDVFPNRQYVYLDDMAWQNGAGENVYLDNISLDNNTLYSVYISIQFWWLLLGEKNANKFRLGFTPHPPPPRGYLFTKDFTFCPSQVPGVKCVLKILGTKSVGDRLLAGGTSSLLTSSFAPFGRSGRFVGPA